LPRSRTPDSHCGLFAQLEMNSKTSLRDRLMTTLVSISVILQPPYRLRLFIHERFYASSGDGLLPLTVRMAHVLGSISLSTRAYHATAYRMRTA
jgi:hypothetical protein